MADPELVARIEEVVRENERLRRRLDYLEPAIGHTAVLVGLATAVRAWRDSETPETKARVLKCIDDYDEDRRRGSSNLNTD